MSIEVGYSRMNVSRVGRSGLLLPKISLGGWHNFQDLNRTRALLHTAVELGCFSIDLANNYGPPPGIAETHFGRVLAEDLSSLRAELVISTKAGYRMWPGPLGEGGSRKHLLTSLDASLRRMKLDYVDIFYSHRYDPNTPLSETIGALAQAVRSGKALYAALSNYPPEAVTEAVNLASSLGLALVANQCSYSILDRSIEKQIVKTSYDHGLSIIAFSPLAQGLLTQRYLTDIPSDSRAGLGSPFLKPERFTEKLRSQLNELNAVAEARDVSLARLALSWVLRDPRVSSALIGASRPEQIQECALAATDPPLAAAELRQIDRIMSR